MSEGLSAVVRRSSSLAVLAFLTVLSVKSAPAAETFFVQGFHGGYYLTAESDYRQALDNLFGVLDRNPNFKVVMELEPYTLERMRDGERFSCEWYGREQQTIPGWWLGGQGTFSARVTNTAARSGSRGLRLVFQSGSYVSACAGVDPAPFRGKVLVFSGWIRQRTGQGAGLYVDAWDAGSYIPGSSASTARVPADGQWHQVQFSWRVPTNAVSCYPQAKCDTQPTDADFDDLSLQEQATGNELLVNNGFEQVTDYSLADPVRLERLRGFVNRGQIEIVGGAYTQPMLYALGAESTVRQFARGLQTVRDILGVPVPIYAAQEPDMTSQLPQLLSQCGFTGVLYRSCWGLFGCPPQRDYESFLWQGNDGSSLLAVPAYAVFPAPRFALTTYPTPDLLQGLAAAGIGRPLFGVLDDFVPGVVPPTNTPLAQGQLAHATWANFGCTISAIPLRNTELIWSAAVRARTPGVHIYIDSRDAGNIGLPYAQSGDVPTDGQWHNLQLRYTVPATATQLYPQARIIALSGDADFDNFRVADTHGTVLAQESFESGTTGIFSAGADRGVEVSTQVASGGAANGQRYVHFQMQAPSIPGQVVTLSEYFSLVNQPTNQWVDAFSGFEFRFPYGLLAGTVQRGDRQTEDQLLQTERLAVLAGDARPNLLQDAWTAHLMGEHHDGWVCPSLIFGFWKQSSYAEMCQAAFNDAQQLYQGIRSSNGCASLAADGTPQITRTNFSVANTSSFARDEIVTLNLSLPRGFQAPGIAAVAPGQPDTSVPAAVTVLKRYSDSTVQQAQVAMRAAVPALSTRRYKVIEGGGQGLHPISISTNGTSLVVDNRFVRLLTSQNGSASIAAPSGAPIPLSLAGTFPQFGDQEVSVQMPNLQIEAGGCSLSGTGMIGGVSYQAALRIEPGSPLVRLKLDFDFGTGTTVGATEGIPGYPAHARDDHKLRLVCQLPAAPMDYFAEAPFEVRRVSEDRYPVQRFAMAQNNTNGLALFPDRASIGLFGRAPGRLELVLAYGGAFIYAPNEFAPLVGRQHFEIGLLPCGDWASDRVPEWAERFAQPLLVMDWSDTPGSGQPLVRLQPEGAALITALAYDGGHLLFRIWRPYPGSAGIEVDVPGAEKLYLTDLLHGRHQAQAGTLRMQQHQVATLCAVRSADSTWRLTARPDSGGYRLQWQGGPQSRQYLERAGSLTGPGASWQIICTNDLPNPLGRSFLDISGTQKSSFYRLRAE